MIKIAELPNFDMADQLKTKEDILIYLNMVIEENDPSELAYALGVIAKSEGMSEIAKNTTIQRPALYKALRKGASPRFDTVNQVVNSLGFKITLSPV
ncbi:transcriptional regulator [Commensalibacter intestini A911]|uniref:Addiction module antitoxin n=2 Tax=Commensalibacter intestini TaxID=479936 RepID=A0A251ZTL4_9PROT|nr:addiction module antidote protein [Commensalibacter intestini]EHD13511.1 transcriptional regulator [Commensalibacter intestini A911]OUI78001.1 addiction module antitoxin [Commensalibacter intestini]